MSQIVRFAVCFVLLALLVPASSYADPMQDAYAAYDAERFAEALPTFEALADQGSEDAAYAAGLMHQWGQGTAPDAARALTFYQKAPHSAPAMTNTGIIYRDGGTGVAPDTTKAAQYLKQGAELDDTAGQLGYGALLWNGTGVQKDPAEALAWWTLAAERGDEAAKGNINAVMPTLPSQTVKAGKDRAVALRSQIKAAREQQEEALVNEIRIGEARAAAPAGATPPPAGAPAAGAPASNAPMSNGPMAPAVNPPAAGAAGVAGAPAANAQAGQPKPAPQLPEGPGLISLTREEIHDPGMGNIASHTLLVPKGWKVAGGVQWAVGRKPFVGLYMTVASPDGRAVSMLPPLSYSYAQLSPQLMQMMQQNGQQFPQPGQPQADGSLWMPPPQDAATHVMRDILPNMRPAAQNARVVSVKQLPEVQKAMTDFLQPLWKLMHQNDAQNRHLGVDSSESLACQIVRVAYTENGQPLEEDFGLAMMFYTTSVRDQMTGEVSMVNHLWSTESLGTARAPAGTLEQNQALMTTVLNSIQSTPRWQTAIDHLKAETAKVDAQIQKDNAEAFRKRQEETARTSAYIYEQNQATYWEGQKTRENLNRKTANAILGTEDYRLTDGSVAHLPNSHSYVHTDNDGHYILSNDMNYKPKDDAYTKWEEIKPLP